MPQINHNNPSLWGACCRPCRAAGSNGAALAHPHISLSCWETPPWLRGMLQEADLCSVHASRPDFSTIAFHGRDPAPAPSRESLPAHKAALISPEGPFVQPFVNRACPIAIATAPSLPGTPVCFSSSFLLRSDFSATQIKNPEESPALVLCPPLPR